MMNGMKIKESGDVDRDFTNLMIPHYQGAIDMARAELQYGKNEQLRRIAQEIIVQQQEILPCDRQWAIRYRRRCRFRRNQRKATRAVLRLHQFSA